MFCASLSTDCNAEYCHRRGWSWQTTSDINNTTPAGGALTTPIDIVNSGEQTDRLFVVQQGGIIKAFT